MKIYIVRHGETIANKQAIMQGRIDTPLTPLGIKLAKETGEGLKHVKFDAVYSSPLKRAHDTADIIMSKNKYKVPVIVLDDRIQEVDMNELEGKPVDFIPKDIINNFFKDPFSIGKIGNGETTQQVCDRTQEFIHDLAKNHDYENVLVTTHGFALRALLNFMYDDPSDFWQEHVPFNCAVNIIEYKDGEFKFIAKDKIYYDQSLALDRYKQKK